MSIWQGHGRMERLERIAENIWDLCIHAPEAAKITLPGQFAHILCGDKLLRRPISICDVAGDALRLVFEVKGEGTAWLAAQKPGAALDILAPLGRGFTLQSLDAPVVFVGGGIGVPPLLYTAKQAGEADAILGFRSQAQAILLEDFKQVCAAVRVATDDGTLGEKGFVTNLLEQYLQERPCGGICACGPLPMLKGVAALAAKLQIPCEVSMEERMGCGVGACLVCACKTRRNGQAHYSHVCKDGPVFNAKEVLFA